MVVSYTRHEQRGTYTYILYDRGERFFVRFSVIKYCTAHVSVAVQLVGYVAAVAPKFLSKYTRAAERPRAVCTQYAISFEGCVDRARRWYITKAHINIIKLITVKGQWRHSSLI